MLKVRTQVTVLHLRFIVGDVDVTYYFFILHVAGEHVDVTFHTVTHVLPGLPCQPLNLPDSTIGGYRGQKISTKPSICLDHPIVLLTR